MKKFKELLFFLQLKGFTNTKLNKEIVPFLNEINGMEECISFLQERSYPFTEHDILFAIEKAQAAYKKIHANNEITVITILDDCYPKQLHDLKDKKPVILYAKGNVQLFKEHTLAVVGTRTPSEWSIKVEENLLTVLFSISKPVIISGLALGCDTIAHEMAILHHVPTVAVLPSGVDAITPKTNTDLAKRIVDMGGCLISEYAPDALAQKSTYIQRDAIIAALSNKLIVIECKEKSGTMHTVNAAKKLGRKIGCYHPEKKYLTSGDYSGNRMLAYTADIIRLQNKEHLKDILKSDTDTSAFHTKQLSITDLS